jgi:hypothetical protein
LVCRGFLDQRRYAQFSKLAIGVTNFIITIPFLVSIGFVQTWLFIEKITFLLAVVSVLAVVSLPVGFIAIWIEALQRMLLRIVIVLRFETFRTGRAKPRHSIAIAASVFFTLFFVVEGIAISDHTRHIAELTIESIEILSSERTRIVFWALHLVPEVVHVVLTAATGDDVDGRVLAVLVFAFAICTADALMCEILCLFAMEKWSSLASLIAMFQWDSCAVALLLFMFHRSGCRPYNWIGDTQCELPIGMDVEITSE